MKAVIPAAGFGTYFLSLIKARPKEVLLVGDGFTIQWVVGRDGWFTYSSVGKGD
jgi:UTP--glucose-1-phosphate uridylyltransferase